MRFDAQSVNGDFRARILCGTRTVLMALDCAPQRRHGLMGFSFWRQGEGEAGGKWLRSQKVFKSVVPDPKALVNGKPPEFRTDRFPVQSFLWGDYTAEPATGYTLRIMPRYGKPGQLKSVAGDEVVVTVRTEPEDDPAGHGVWFNRGAIASQHFAREFGNARPTTQQLEDLAQPVTRWLSRGLAEACIAFIDAAAAGDGLNACVYEFTYKPVLNALKAALDRGVLVRICHHDTPANRKAIAAAGLPAKVGRRKVLYPRTQPKIPHNKFIVRLAGTRPVAVWTGSTNITPSGFTGQSNVGHQVNDARLAAQYLAYWRAIAADPDRLTARRAATRLAPHPAELVPPRSTTLVFSPRHRSAMLDWYANRMEDAQQTVMFTAAFGVNRKLAVPLGAERDFLRFLMLEGRLGKEEQAQLRRDRDLVIAYGAALGRVATFGEGGGATKKIAQFGLDQWFYEEEHFRKAGHIFYVHTKILLVDPLSDDPLVCTGSANFSENSLLDNDENMLLVRGHTRVADIYLTEFDRLFRHFYFRDVANEIQQRGSDAQAAFLDEGQGTGARWHDSYFRPAAFKTRRREMFFATGGKTWVAAAGARARDETASYGDKPL
ncbi:MAG: hypothetical protein JNJ89_15325 [Rubrivivax sp.]|nr:hypothetical protein [Rubrivivax sp.]